MTATPGLGTERAKREAVKTNVATIERTFPRDDNPNTTHRQRVLFIRAAVRREQK